MAGVLPVRVDGVVVVGGVPVLWLVPAVLGVHVGGNGWCRGSVCSVPGVVGVPFVPVRVPRMGSMPRMPDGGAPLSRDPGVVAVLGFSHVSSIPSEKINGCWG